MMKMLFLILLSYCIAGLTKANYGSPSSLMPEDAIDQPKVKYVISCVPSAHGITDIYWSKPDGTRVVDDQKYNVYSFNENGLLFLTIVDPHRGNEGEYICHEVSDTGKTTVRSRFTFPVLAESPPRFEDPYLLIEVYEDLNITLVCDAQGEQPIEYKWIDNQSVDITESTSDAVISKRGNFSELHLLRVSNKTIGIFTCVATNDVGTNSKLFHIVVLKREGTIAPFFNESREIVYGTELQKLTLICIAEGIPAPSYTWFDKFGKELNKNHPRVISHDQLNYTTLERNDVFNSSIIIDVSTKYGLLTFVSLNQSDSGDYVCKAENLFGTSDKIYSVYVNSSADEFPPVFHKTRVEVTGIENEILTLPCQASGNPRPKYTWYNKYGERLDRFHQRVIDLDRWNDSLQIPHRRPSTILVSPTNGTLIFVQLKREDDGHITCYAENSVGKASKTYRIYVNEAEDEFPPVFNETRVEVEAAVNQSLTLCCEAKGNPRPKYSWYNQYGNKLDRFNPRVVDLDWWNDTSEIPPNKRPPVILVSPTNGTLKFVQLKRYDEGNYTCYAENSAGNASKYYGVYLNDSEVVDDDVTVEVQNTTDTSVTFRLIPPSAAARRVQAKYRLDDKMDFMSIYWSPGQECRVSGLLSGAKYFFEFGIGQSSSWTNQMTVALRPGSPEIIIRQVAAKKAELEFFRPFYYFTYQTLNEYVIKYRTVEQSGGNSWKYNYCEATITLPSCFGNSYEISRLQSRVFYSITVQAVGPGGHSEPSELKIYIP